MTDHVPEDLLQLTLPAALDGVIRLMAEVGGEFGSELETLGALRHRLAQGRFQLAVLGQFKRGKSSLLNALLGEAILPSSVVPLTSIPTFLRYGARPRVRVEYGDGRPPDDVTGGTAAELNALVARFVTEDANPRNRLGVSQVEVFYPAPVLADGVVLIDTPGIGSTYRHNTDTTLRLLPQCDAALFVVSADPPVTEVEVGFLGRVRSSVARLFVVLNKVDYLGPEEREAAVDFLRSVLRAHEGVEDAPIFEVSARDGLAAARAGDSIGWRDSGLQHLNEYLVRFLAREKSTAHARATSQKAAAITGDVVMRIRLTLGSLRLPLDELKGRLARLERRAEDTRLRRASVRDILAGEERRLVERLYDRAEALRSRASADFRNLIERAISTTEDRISESSIREGVAREIPVFFDEEFTAFARGCRAEVTAVLEPYRRQADDLVEAVRKDAADAFGVAYSALASTDVFDVLMHPYWVTEQWLDQLGPVPAGLLDQMFPLRLRRWRIGRRVMAQMELLVVRNVGRLRSSTQEAIENVFQHFRTGMDKRLREAMAAVQAAAQSALASRDAGAATVAAEEARLGAAASRLEGLKRQLDAVHGAA